MRRFAMSDRSHQAVPAVHVVLHRIDPVKNMARYYVLSVELTLFGSSALVREWGRIGSQGQRRSEFFEQSTGASVALDTWLQRKCRRGYVVRSLEASDA